MRVLLCCMGVWTGDGRGAGKHSGVSHRPKHAWICTECSRHENATPVACCSSLCCCVTPSFPPSPCPLQPCKQPRIHARTSVEGGPPFQRSGGVEPSPGLQLLWRVSRGSAPGGGARWGASTMGGSSGKLPSPTSLLRMGPPNVPPVCCFVFGYEQGSRGR